MTDRKNNAFFTYLALTVAILIPVPGRFAYGIIMLLLFNSLIFFGSFFSYTIYYMKLESMKTPLLIIFLLCLSMLIKAILNFFSPILALSLGYVIYLPAASTALLSYFFERSYDDLGNNININMIETLYFSIFSLAIFLFRDIVGYGTITFPSKNGFFVLNTFFTKTDFSAASFVATIPGAFIIISLLFALIVFFMNKIHSIERAKQ